MYIELDHNLVAGKVENINEKVVLEGRKEEEGQDGPSEIAKNWRTDKYLLKKYNISKQPVRDVLLKKESKSPQKQSDYEEEFGRLTLKTLPASSESSQKQNSKKRSIRSLIKSIKSKKDVPPQKTKTSGESLHQHFDFSQTKTKSEAFAEREDDSEKQVKKEEEVVIGSDGEVFFDHDFGFFGAVLACYNNHWVLKTSPDDWWNVIVR